MVSMIPPPTLKSPPLNYIDNSDFVIAQAGYGGMHGTTRYAADRWVNTYGFGTFAAANPGVAISYATNHAYADQKIAQGARLIGKVVTLSVMTDEYGVLLCSGRYTGTTAVDARYFNNTCEIDITDSLVRIVVTAGTLTVRWAALYEGEYTADALPAYTPRPYSVELGECQRYYQTFGFGRTAIGINSNRLYIYGAFSVPMRIVPSVSVISRAHFDGMISGYVIRDATITLGTANAIYTDGIFYLLLNTDTTIAEGLVYACGTNCIGLSADL